MGIFISRAPFSSRLAGRGADPESFPEHIMTGMMERLQELEDKIFSLEKEYINCYPEEEREISILLFDAEEEAELIRESFYDNGNDNRI